MSYIDEVVKRRLSTGPKSSDYMYQQSVRIPERVHQKLRALAQSLGVPKTTLLAELVAAAIDQAIDALPDERPVERVALDAKGKEHPIPDKVWEQMPTIRASVRERAEELYRDYLVERNLASAAGALSEDE